MKGSSGLRRQAGDSRGFTLLELLTVVGIISVLAAILFPLISSAKRAATARSCASNMRQAGAALLMYSGDHDQRYPINFLTPSESNYVYAEQLTHDTFCLCQKNSFRPLYCWVTSIKPYLTVSKLMCPQDKVPSRAKVTSYEYKLMFAFGDDYSEIEHPTKVALLWERLSFHDAELLTESDSRAQLQVLFLDGSVKMKDLSRTTTSALADGPDLHFLFPGVGDDLDYAGEDFLD